MQRGGKGSGRCLQLLRCRFQRGALRQKCSRRIHDRSGGCRGRQCLERQERGIRRVCHSRGNLAVNCRKLCAGRQEHEAEAYQSGSKAHVGPVSWLSLTLKRPSTCRKTKPTVAQGGLSIERTFIYPRRMARRSGSHSEITGPRIRAAALKLFARHGFAAVSMRQIAAEVGVQAGALYLYTVDKEALLVDLLSDHMETLIRTYDARTLPADPRMRLRDFVRFHIDYNRDHRDEVFLSYMELRNLGPENFQRIEALRRSYEDRLGLILADGRAAGCFAAPDIRLATMAIIAMLNGVNTWFRDGGRLTLDEISALYCDMVEKTVAA